MINRIYVVTGCKNFSVNERNDKDRLFSLLSLCTFSFASIQFFKSAGSNGFFNRIDIIGYDANKKLFNDVTIFLFLRKKLREMYGSECLISDILKHEYCIDDITKYYEELRIPRISGNCKFTVVKDVTRLKIFSKVSILSDSFLDKIAESDSSKPKWVEYKLCRIDVASGKVNWWNPINDYKPLSIPP